MPTTHSPKKLNNSSVHLRLCTEAGISPVSINVTAVAVQAELHASLSNVSRLPSELVAANAVHCKAVSMEVGSESVTDTQSCVQGVQLMRLEHTEMEVSDRVNLSARCTSPVNSGPANAGVEELNATMHHVIDTACYPFSSEPDNNLLNASVMIDPSNPFDEEMIERLLSKLAHPLTSHENYHRVNADMPKICARRSLQLGMFYTIFCKYVAFL